MGAVRGALQTVRMLTSKITDHRSPHKYNNNKKVWNIARITKEWANAVWKMAPIYLLYTGSLYLKQEIHSSINCSTFRDYIYKVQKWVVVFYLGMSHLQGTDALSCPT